MLWLQFEQVRDSAPIPTGSQISPIAAATDVLRAESIRRMPIFLRTLASYQSIGCSVAIEFGRSGNQGPIARGHDVTLFASGDSHTTADHVAVVKQSLRLSKRPRDPTIWHMRQLMEVMRMAHHFDIVHFHTDWFHFPVWRGSSTPQLTTLHGRLDIADLRAVYDEFRDASRFGPRNHE